MINLDFLYYILFILNGFFLGSLPFGYVISRLSTSKDVFEVGWKKNSASNVFKNIGKWQGILTAVLDAAKGFLAVYIASLAGCPSFVIALIAAAAVAGHNWSPLLDFKGGRGIATLAGSMLPISPYITILLAILCGLFAVLWTASIGTIVALIVGITVSFANPSQWNLTLLLLFSLPLIALKRLSPIKDVIPFDKNQTLIENRLIFDQDTVPPFRTRKLKNPIPEIEKTPKTDKKPRSPKSKKPLSQKKPAKKPAPKAKPKAKPAKK